MTNPPPRPRIVALILAALLGGGFYVAKSTGITPWEQTVIDRSGGDPTVRGLMSAHDWARWTPDPVFAPATVPTGEFELGGYDSLANFGYGGAVASPVPADLSGRRIVFNNVRPAWPDNGPLWGIRAYNVVGELRDLELWRCGDWTRGREGHAVYLNVAGSLLIDGLVGVQCGGQLLQLVWRVGETRMPREEWPDSGDLIDLRRLRAIDCGAITAGMAVRASWPVSIFATGARVSITDLQVRTRLPEFVGDRGEKFRSHGALMLGLGEEGRRTPSLVLEGLSGRVTRSDRDEVRLSAVDLVILRGISLTEEGGDGVCTVALVEDCGSALVEGCPQPVRIKIQSVAKPWGEPVRVVDVPIGGRWTWSRGQ